MADRRMFSKRIVESARFIKMPPSTQCLYFHLGINADDDGIVEAYSVMRQLGATEDDLFILSSKGFVTILNEDLVTYINDWSENNKLRADRKIDSIYKPLLLQILPVNDDNRCIQNRVTDEDRCIQNSVSPENLITDDNKREQNRVSVRIGKDRIGEDSIYKSIVGYLNEKAGTGYKPISKKTQSLINARMNEGFTLEDFRVVIDKKCSEWKSDKKMSQYLRPETLFGTKFESYLNAGGTNGLRDNAGDDEREAEGIERTFRHGTESEVFGDF